MDILGWRHRSCEAEVLLEQRPNVVAPRIVDLDDEPVHAGTTYQRRMERCAQRDLGTGARAGRPVQARR
jgi:hypothetical protein